MPEASSQGRRHDHHHHVWDGAEDLDGTGHYVALGLDAGRRAFVTQDDVRSAFRKLARTHHPDKGGDAALFARIRLAYDVLIDAERRETYDAWQSQVEFRNDLKGVKPRYNGGEDLMLDEFEKNIRSAAKSRPKKHRENGLFDGDAGVVEDGSESDDSEEHVVRIDPMTQLVVLCEVCGRPSTCECWTCGAKICSFCTLKRHWKGKFGLHWPMVDAPGSMVEQLGRKEMEKKRIEDAKRYELEDPNFRSDFELKQVREFKDVAYELIQNLGPKAKVTYDLRLAKYYMWSQTESQVFFALYIPTGYHDKEIIFEASPGEILIQPENSPPIVNRLFEYGVAHDRPIETRRSHDHRVFTAVIPKHDVGEKWKRLFRGDPDGARCIEPVYTLSEDSANVVMEIELPFWIDSGDVRVQFTRHDMQVHVRNELTLHKTFWRNAEEERRNPEEYDVIDVTQSMWSLDDDVNDEDEKCKCLMINLVKPPLTTDEIKWKKGVRNDNLNAARHGNRAQKGFRFFVDDEDEFNLEDLLQALCFLDSGVTFSPKKPWDRDGTSKRVHDVDFLSEDVQKILESFLNSEE